MVLEKGKFSGLVHEDRIVDAQYKKYILLTLAAELKVPITRVLAVGDGANDIPMLQTAGIGIAFCAKPIVRESVHYRLDVPDLSIILYLLQQLKD